MLSNIGDMASHCPDNFIEINSQKSGWHSYTSQLFLGGIYIRTALYNGQIKYYPPDCNLSQALEKWSNIYKI